MCDFFLSCLLFLCDRVVYVVNNVEWMERQNLGLSSSMWCVCVVYCVCVCLCVSLCVCVCVCLLVCRLCLMHQATQQSVLCLVNMRE